jgi:hypothetical protein
MRAAAPVGRRPCSRPRALQREAPATWTVLELKSIPPSAFGRAGVVTCPTPLAPLPIFSHQAWPHGALRVASGRFLSLDRRMPTCQLSPSSDMPSHPLGSAMANQRHRAFAAGMEELASIPDAGGQLLARVRLSQPSALGRITAGTGAPQ